MSDRHGKKRIYVMWQKQSSAQRLPIAAVAWMPGGPELATIEASQALPKCFIARIGARVVAGPLPSISACRADVAKVIDRAHEAVANGAYHAN